MYIFNWNAESPFNSKFFAYSSKPKENTITSEFISGRTVSVQANTKKIMIHSFNVKFTKTELNAFWTWFNDTLGQTANGFYCPAIGDKVYRFTSIPEPQDTDQRTRVLSCEVEEVF